MNKADRFKMRIDTLYMRSINTYRNTIGMLRIDSKTKSILLSNQPLKNSHSDKRCFILGNGPSLKNVDFSRLSDEYVFTVNQSSRNPFFETLSPNFHVWADPNFFKIDKNQQEDLELFEYMTVPTRIENCLCFYPVDQYDFCCENNLINNNTRFFAPYLKMYDDFNEIIRFDKLVPGFGTVVQTCIVLAIYMGFKDIYLLGCDNTSIMVTINSALELNGDQDYAYHVSTNEKKRMEEMVRSSSVEAYTRSYLDSLVDYRRLFSFAEKNGIRLINCS